MKTPPMDAIQARVLGELDNPNLLKYGALSTNVSSDVQRIIESMRKVRQ
jgi:hypothetical protein